MAEPLDFLLLANLKAALQAIRVADGYYYGVDDAAVKMDAETTIDELVGPESLRPFVLIEPRPEEWEYHPSGEVLYSVPLTLHWVHDPLPMSDALLGEPAQAEDASRMRVYYRGVADIEKAITRDTSRGGRSVDTRITGRRWNPVNSGQDVWAEIDIELKVYRTYGVPA